MSIQLLARFPKLRSPSQSWPVIPDKNRSGYPELASDFSVLDRYVTPAFTTYDLAALRDQNRYRRQQVLIFVGTALLTGLGGLQAVFPAQRWPGVLLAVLGVALTASTRFAKESESHADYLKARVKAERLRALYFLYLSETAPYAEPGRETNLRRAVAAIEAGREPQ